MRQAQRAAAVQQLEARAAIAQEWSAGRQVEARIDVGYRLAAYKNLRAAQLNQLTTELSWGKPELELELRQTEQMVAWAANQLIFNHLTREQH